MNSKQRRREVDYLELTPISPIKFSFSMDKQITPETETEPLEPKETTTSEPNNVTFVEQFIELLKSDSDMVKFEAASSLLHILTAESAVSGKA